MQARAGREELKAPGHDEQTVQALIKYIKEEDIETCINALFVLTDSKPDALEKLMRSLQIEKKELIYMLGEILRRNYELHKETVSGGGRGGFGGFSFRQNYHFQAYAGNYSSYKGAQSGAPLELANPIHNPSPSIISEISSPNPQGFQRKKSRSRSHESSTMLVKTQSAPVFGNKPVPFHTLDRY